MAEEITRQNEEGGNRASFQIAVQFHQNSTWQGTVTWLEKNTVQHFRSELELLRLMSEALEEGASEIHWG